MLPDQLELLEPVVELPAEEEIPHEIRPPHYGKPELLPPIPSGSNVPGILPPSERK